ncbi:MAG TPA: GldG family protein [Thermoclostridium caenicola]|uniref:GldG family protein n=1 Tax=Thermoclostridium caenicola TaxID=659425 RepID=UPI002BA670CF|nr:GldG family protein [Thermoclostridium caenicola]HOK42727.1 GldG family protein [Thermoclostridium caenicola]HOL84985.1 GldG family protein [Thermoclostridium caenicola]HOP73308.1 GldG family protein [Thermoclostridium caenicola]HPO77136.1 GldG family protein [Thermoclostridium caenicola]
MKMDFFRKRSFKYGSYSVVMTVVVIAVIVMVNVILGFSGISKRLRFDITRNKMFSISQQSIDMVKSLDRDVEIFILSSESSYSNIMVKEVVNQYVVHGNGRVIGPRYVDLDKDPTFISKNFDPDQVKGINTGDIVVRSGKNMRVLNNQDFMEVSYDYYGGAQVTGLKVEQAFTSAIRSVTAEKTATVYFVSGHGEYKSDELSQLKTTLTLNNYNIETLTLTSPVPGEVDVLFFPSPTSDLLGSELENLLAFLERGGDAVFLFDVQSTIQQLPNFNDAFSRYSLQLNYDLVNEFSQANYLKENWMIRPMVYMTDVTKHLNPDQLFIYLPMSRSIGLLSENKQNLEISPLFGTTDNSTSVDLNTGAQRFGPFLLGALSELEIGLNNHSRIALVGNCTFITDDYISELGDNGSRYIVSILNWMQERTDEVLVPAKSLERPPLNMTQQSRVLVFFLLTAVIPLVIIGTGLFVWIRRKNL